MRFAGPANLVPAGVFLMVAVAACGSSATSSHHPDPRSLALRPSDFTGGFTELRHRYWTSAELAQQTGTPRAQYDRHGLTRAYETSFSRLTHVGLARVADLVYQFNDQSGAGWFLARLRSRAQNRHYRPFRFNVPLGDQLYAYSFHPKFNGLVGTEYIVYYRRQSTIVSFIAAGQAGPSIDSAEMVPFVGSVDLRAQKAYRQ